MLVALAVIYIYVVTGMLGFSIGIASALWFAALKLVVLGVNLLTFTIFVQAIMSWLGPGVNNPASNILWRLNEPILRPVRDRKSVVEGTSVSVRVDLGGGWIMKKKKIVNINGKKR